MTVPLTIFARVAIAAGLAVAALANPGRARADILPISVQVGGQIPIDGNARGIAGDAQTDLGLNVDLGPKTQLPIRASVQLNPSAVSLGLRLQL